MTTKEIAQAVGKNERTIRDWIGQITSTAETAVTTEKSAVVNSIHLKAGSKDSRHPADYTLEETLAIIEAGMGPDAAGIFRANATPEAGRGKAKVITAAYLHELTAAYDKSIISRDDWRDLVGLPPLGETVGKHLSLPLSLDEELKEGFRFYRRIAEEARLVRSGRADRDALYRRGPG
jgi:hypothetical protein